MNKFFYLIYLIFVLALSISCVQEKSADKEISNNKFVNPSNADTLKFTSEISSIFQDSKGNYWFGSRKEGVAYYNGKSFKYLTTSEGLSDNQIRSIQEDANGNIWFGTGNGVSSYDGKKITNHTPKIDVGSQNDWNKTENDLWFNAGNNTGVYRYDGKELEYLAFPNPKVITPGNTYHVTDISSGKNDMLWMATYAGIFGYDGNEFTLINDETLGLKKETGQLHIRSILEDSKGRLWIGNNGIGVLLKEKATIINFSEENNLIHPTSLRSSDQSEAGTLEHVFEIAEDGEGNIWFGDRDTGVWKYDGSSMSNYTKDVGLTHDFVLSIYKDNNDEMWVGLADGKVFKFNGKTFDKQF